MICIKLHNHTGRNQRTTQHGTTQTPQKSRWAPSQPPPPNATKGHQRGQICQPNSINLSNSNKTPPRTMARLSHRQEQPPSHLTLAPGRIRKIRCCGIFHRKTNTIRQRQDTSPESTCSAATRTLHRPRCNDTTEEEPRTCSSQGSATAEERAPEMEEQEARSAHHEEDDTARSTTER